MSGDPRRKVGVGGAQPFGKSGGSNWGRGQENQSLYSYGLATLRLPPGCCAEADGVNGSF